MSLAISKHTKRSAEDAGIVDGNESQKFQQMGNDYLKQGKYKKAIQRFRTALTFCSKESAQNAEILYQIGNVYIVQGDDKHAENCFNKAIKYDPDNIQIRETLGDLFLKKGSNLEAWFNFSLVKTPNNPDILAKLAIVNFRTGKYSDAYKHFKKIKNGKIKSSATRKDLKKVSKEMVRIYKTAGNFLLAVAIKLKASGKIDMTSSIASKSLHCFQRVRMLNR